MSDFECMPTGTAARLAAAEAEREALKTENERLNGMLSAANWNRAQSEHNALRAECDAVLIALEKIAGFTLSQFMGPHDMAQTCVTVARAASSAARRLR